MYELQPAAGRAAARSVARRELDTPHGPSPQRTGAGPHPFDEHAKDNFAQKKEEKKVFGISSERGASVGHAARSIRPADSKSRAVPQVS